MRGNIDEAERLLGEIREHDLSALGSSDRAILASQEAMVAVHRRSREDALQLALNALEIAKASGVRETEADCRRVLGILHVRGGDAQAAEHALRQSLALATSIGDPYRAGLTLLELGQAAESVADRQQSIEEAMRIFTEIGAAYDSERALAALESLHPAAAAIRSA